MNDPADLATLQGLRKHLKLTQEEAGGILGLSKRGVQQVEGGTGADRAAYHLGLERYALRRAVETGRIELAPPAVRADALALARLITGG